MEEFRELRECAIQEYQEMKYKTLERFKIKVDYFCFEFIYKNDNGLTAIKLTRAREEMVCYVNLKKLKLTVGNIENVLDLVIYKTLELYYKQKVNKIGKEER